ncbi:Tumor necrosis factor receptor superfamily member 6B [Oryzias melastigma]|uniref:Tumor necrosis factor receptor superfamily member 6B n=1 Tax=Oryzias melastigma TaxID=30732 RepID=A0A834CGN0_ORYME|nr:Tumor necrosis factor receptor superfamily member 6B [Oryzias melastigma]
MVGGDLELAAARRPCALARCARAAHSSDVFFSVSQVFAVLLLLLVASDLHGYSIDNPLTYERKDFVTGKPVKCSGCQPGFYLRAHCTTTQASPVRAVSDRHVHGAVELHREVMTKQCTAFSNCQCECKGGFFFNPVYNMCTRHIECPSGQGVLTEGTANKNTVCQTCPDGTFSNISSAQRNCTKHRSCSDAGLKTVLRGSSWHDSVCGNCDELKDGADYLKEILPDFFIHHKMNIKRKRRVVHKLLSESGEKNSGTSQMDVSQLQRKIEEWAPSSTPNQVHKLIEILSKVGADSNAEKLKSKLNRINRFLTEDCSVTME